MKICMITGSFSPIKCGVGDYTEILCDNLSDENELFVITSKHASYNYKKKYKIFNVIDKWNIKGMLDVRDKIIKYNPDIIHIQYPTSEYYRNIFMPFFLLLIIRKHKIISTIHEYSDIRFIRKILTIPFLIFSDKVIVVDKRYISDMKKLMVLDESKFEYINIASNIPKSNLSNDDREIIRSKYLSEHNKTIMGFFGFINKDKGLEEIIIAMGKLKEEKELKSVLLIIGELKEYDEYHKHILGMIKNLNLQDNIYITGYLDKHDVGSYISCTDYIVLPFLNGASSKNGSLLAALQENIKVITTIKSESNIGDYANLSYINLKKEKLQNALYLEIKKNQNITNRKDFKQYSIKIPGWREIKNKHLSIYNKLLNEK